MVDTCETTEGSDLPRGAPCSFEIKAWDSEFFGFKVADFAPEKHDPDMLQHAVQHAEAEGVTLLVYRAPLDTTLTPAPGMTRVDRRHTYTFDLQATNLDTLVRGGGNVEIFSGMQSNETLETIAVGAGAESRFFKDPIFPRPAAIALYKAWMRASVEGDMADVVFVARDDDGEIAGIGAGRIDADGVGQPTLMAIRDHMFGKGLGRSFVLACMTWLKNQGVSRAQITTQESNTLACNTYKRMGWTFESSQEIFHIWLDEPTVKSRYL